MPSLPSVYDLRNTYYQRVVDELQKHPRVNRARLERIAAQVGLHAEDMSAVLANLESAGMVCEMRTPSGVKGSGAHWYWLPVDEPVPPRPAPEELRKAGYVPPTPKPKRKRSGFHCARRGEAARA